MFSPSSSDSFSTQRTPSQTVSETPHGYVLPPLPKEVIKRKSTTKRMVAPHGKHTSALRTTKGAKLVCIFPGCYATLGRRQELERHCRAMHTKAVLWCPAFDCHRNAGHGHRPFKLRGDKVIEHIKNVHTSDSDKLLWETWCQDIESAVKLALG
jgi:hypothetical protein